MLFLRVLLRPVLLFFLFLSLYTPRFVFIAFALMFCDDYSMFGRYLGRVYARTTCPS